MAAAIAQRVAESELFVAGERTAAANGPNNWRSLFASPKERRGCILTSLLLAVFCGQVSLDGVIRACRKDWYSAAIGAVLSSDLGAKGAPRSCPARLYRRCGASVVRRDAVMNRMEDLNVKICQEAIT